MLESELEVEDDSVTPEDVLAYLEDHPDFLKTHAHLMEGIDVSKKSGDRNVADFQSYMIKRLKADKEEAVSTTEQLVEASRANMTNQQRINLAVLRLLEARSFEDFIHILTIDLAAFLDVDIAVLLVEADGQTVPHIQTTGIRILPEGTSDKWMQGKPILLQSNISGIEAIYGGGASLVKSQILLRLDISPGTPPALMAFGSRDPELFSEGQATDQVQFLARVIERCIRQWLQLPHQV